MPRRYHRAPQFRREHAYVLLFIPACTLVTCVSLVLADVYHVPELARACTMHSCVTREGFRLRVNLQKTRVHGCAHEVRAILNAGTVLASIKFKLSCTVLLSPFSLCSSILGSPNFVVNSFCTGFLVSAFLSPYCRSKGPKITVLCA